MSASRRPLWLLVSVVLSVVALSIGRGVLVSAGERGGRGAGETNGRPPILIDSVLFDGYAADDADEAVRIINASAAAATLIGWRLGDGGSPGALLPSLTLAPGAALWMARDAGAFRFQFGRAPDLTLSPWPGYSNAGDEVVLRDATGAPADVLVYLAGDATQAGWLGPTLAPYRVSGLFAAEGQVLYRRRDPTGAPVADTDSAADWAQSTGDPIAGRKVRYPGWETDRFQAPVVITATAMLTVAVAPDNAYEVVVGAIGRARSSIQLSSLTLEHAGVGEALAAAARRGVAVTALLEGAPPGGLTDQERYVCGLIERAGGACWFMISDENRRVHNRYRFLHAKYLVIDDRISAISSENFSPDSLPDDDKADGTLGRRGVVLLTDARAVAAHLTALFTADLDPAHPDLVRWSAADPVYGPPPDGFTPITESGGTGYAVRFPQPAVFYGSLVFEIIQAPENSLRAMDGLLGLLGRVGEGDTLLVEQLEERPHWGATTSNPAADPNPRLEAYLDAARRGADVTLLLDAFFDDADSATSNAAACAYANDTARRESLRLRCQVGNPAGLGLHNKMVLAQIDGRGVIHVGSLNGTEMSNKGNRELAVQVRSDAAYAYLAELFAGDLSHTIHLPVILGQFQGAATHPLISEIVYDTPGQDEAEFVEIVNPTGAAIDLTGYALGDAVLMTDFEDMRLLPFGIVLPPNGVLVVTLSAVAFRAEFGVEPNLEILDSDPAVPDLIDLPAWGDPEAVFQLGNLGDEVLLMNQTGVVDVVTYGDGAHPAAVACPLLAPPAHTLERYPYWRDSRVCPSDFRAWPFPSPGRLP